MFDDDDDSKTGETPANHALAALSASAARDVLRSLLQAPDPHLVLIQKIIAKFSRDVFDLWSRLPEDHPLWREVVEAAASLDLRLSESQRVGLVQLWALVQYQEPNPVNPYWILAGYAGTGKTTILKVLIFLARQIRDVVAVTPTGRASVVLRTALTGLQPLPEVRTIHSACYSRVAFTAPCPACTTSPVGRLIWGEETVITTCPTCQAKIPTVSLPPKPAFTGAREAVARGGLLIVDEASMVGRQLYEGILASCQQNDGEEPREPVGDSAKRFAESHLTRGRRILFVGDPGQLDPVLDQVVLPWSDPTVLLHEIHRQASSNPIMRCLQRLRQPCSEPIWRLVPDTFRREGALVKIDCTNLSTLLVNVGQWYRAGGAPSNSVVLTANNPARVAANREIRNICLGVNAPVLVPGERIMCLKNNHAVSIYNGDVVTISALRPLGGPFVQMVGDATEVQFVEFPGRSFVLFPDTLSLDKDELAAYWQGLRGRLGAYGKVYRDAFSRWSEDLLNLDPDPEDPLWQATQDGNDLYVNWAFQELTGLVHPRSVMEATYGYACTVHKAQGSQYQRVAFIWNKTVFGMLHKDPRIHKLIYTAFSRTTTHLTVFVTN